MHRPFYQCYQGWTKSFLTFIVAKGLSQLPTYSKPRVCGTSLRKTREGWMVKTRAALGTIPAALLPLPASNRAGGEVWDCTSPSPSVYPRSLTDTDPERQPRNSVVLIELEREEGSKVKAPAVTDASKFFLKPFPWLMWPDCTSTTQHGASARKIENGFGNNYKWTYWKCDSSATVSITLIR